MKKENRAFKIFSLCINQKRQAFEIFLKPQYKRVEVL